MQYAHTLPLIYSQNRNCFNFCHSTTLSHRKRVSKVTRNVTSNSGFVHPEKFHPYSKGCLVENFHFVYSHILLKSDNHCKVFRYWYSSYSSFHCVRGQTREGFHYSLAGNSRHVWLFGSPHLEWFSGGRKHRLSSHEGKILITKEGLKNYTNEPHFPRKEKFLPHVAPWSTEMSVAQISFERSRELMLILFWPETLHDHRR